MNLGKLTSLTTCPRCGFSIPIYSNEEYTKCKNCEKKINLKINDMFEGEKDMVNKQEYEKGIRCKGMCGFCGDKTICYQGIKWSEEYGQHKEVDIEAKLMQETISQALNDTTNDLYFAKVEPNAIIPSKRDEDAGYDIYTCETETIVIPPCSTRMIDTGIAIACSKNYFPKFFDKGGMGSKGIIVGAGVGDSGYRDKYFIPLINTNENKYVVITNQSQEEINIANYFNLETKEFTYFEDEYFDKLNDEEYNLFFEEHIDKSDCIIKPLKKAITQFVMLPVPKMNVKEITYEELKNIKSERGLGKLGSSGK